MIRISKLFAVPHKGRYVAVISVLAFAIASAVSFAAPRKTAAYTNCVGTFGAARCSARIYDCLNKRPQPVLRKNTSDWKCTAAIQGFMNEAFNRGLKVDGIYGPATELTVAWFQHQMGIKPDGVIGSVTWGKINDVCRVFGEQNPICASTFYVYR